MTLLTIDTQRNLVSVEEGEVYKFNRRWESRILALMLQAAKASGQLNASDINHTLQQHGQVQPLNRAQLQRLFQNIRQFLSSLPGQPLQIVTPPRKSTVGPWRLVFHSSITFEIYGDRAEHPGQPTLLLAPNIDQLLQLLSDLLVSDGFAVHGDYRSAIEAIQPLHTLPLTPEGQCMVWLREAMWQKRLGCFDIARALTRRVMATATPADPGLQSHALFFCSALNMMPRQQELQSSYGMR